MNKSIFITASVVILLVGAALGVGQEGQSEQDKKIDELIGKLGTRYWEKAADELVAIGIEAIDPLIETVNIGTGRPSENAVLVLARIGTQKAIDTVVGALKNQKFHVRIRAYAAMALGEIGSEDFVGELIEALKSDKAWWVRHFAVGSLGKIGSERGIDPLIDAVNDKSQYVRRAAVSVLGEMKPEKSVLPLVVAMKDDDWQVRLLVPDILMGFGSKVEGHLLKALKADNTWTKLGATNVLGRLKSEKAVVPLLSLLQDQEQMLRDEAAVALSRINSQTAEEPLIELLKHETGLVREGASWVLGEMKSTEAVKALIKSLADQETGWMAAVALGKIGDERAFDPLKKRAADQGTRVGQAAAWALERMKRKPL